MKFSKENLRIFGLNKTETRILDALLEGGNITVSDLGRKARVNRTTVYPALLRLQKGVL